MHIGIDLVKIDRLNYKNNSLISKILTDEEKSIFYGEKDKQKFLAGRFALKEAIIKTFEGKETIIMNEINIIRDENCVPICEYKNHVIKGSISHDGEYAIAMAIRLE